MALYAQLLPLCERVLGPDDDVTQLVAGAVAENRESGQGPSA